MRVKNATNVSDGHDKPSVSPNSVSENKSLESDTKCGKPCKDYIYGGCSHPGCTPECHQPPEYYEKKVDTVVSQDEYNPTYEPEKRNKITGTPYGWCRYCKEKMQTEYGEACLKCVTKITNKEIEHISPIEE